MCDCKSEMSCSIQATDEFSVGVLEPKCEMLFGSKTILFIAIGENMFCLFVFAFCIKILTSYELYVIPACGYRIASDKTQHRC